MNQGITWRARKREIMRNMYYSGLANKRSIGWCIFSSDGGRTWHLKETGKVVVTETGARTANKYGPFPSLEGAQAAFQVIGDIK